MRTCRPWIEAKIALTALFLLLAGCGGNAPAGDGGPAPGAEAEPAPVQEAYRWKLITTWPKNLPGLGMAAENFAARLRTMSAGRLDIQVYGAGELVGAFEVFDCRLPGHCRDGPRRRLLLAGQAAGGRPVLHRAVRHDRPGDERLAIPRRRPGTLAGAVRALLPGALGGRQFRHADGRLVQQGNPFAG